MTVLWWLVVAAGVCSVRVFIMKEAWRMTLVTELLCREDRAQDKALLHGALRHSLGRTENLHSDGKCHTWLVGFNACICQPHGYFKESLSENCS